ncbi:MAG TPA: mannitol dehydrogenase family protein [Chloroflexota bacterium]|nr:mannitol dehydrogenase family protein [Chloroflexota bacterium]
METPSESRPGGVSQIQPLREETLKVLGAGIAVPTYPRTRLTQAIVHIGVGGFHRAHQAVYLDDLAEQRVTDQWGLLGVGLLPQDKRMEQALLPQQCLFTVVERSAHAETARVVGAMTGFLFAPEHTEQTLRVLAGAETRLVTLTITEGGYNFNQVTGEFEATNPEVQADLQHPATPTTVFGYLCEALDRRRRAGLPPFTLLSCDNLQSNGHVLKKMILSFAALRDRELATWIDANVAFPSSMVDRITIQTTDEDRAMVARTFGIADAWPVITEPFRQWVIEDTFCNGRPPLEEVGAQFVADVHPYEMMKIRLLNASHQAMGYLGYLCGYRYVHEVMNDPLFQEFIRRLMAVEVTPLLAPVPGVDLDAYKRSLLERFANPKIGDQVSRICFDGSARMPKFLLPSLSEALASGRPHTLLTLAVAGWFRYLFGVDEHGEPIPVEDQLAGELQARAREGREDPRPLLRMHSLFGDVADNEAFVTTLEEALRLLYTQGARATLSHYLAAADGAAR